MINHITYSPCHKILCHNKQKCSQMSVHNLNAFWEFSTKQKGCITLLKNFLSGKAPVKAFIAPWVMLKKFYSFAFWNTIKSIVLPWISVKGLGSKTFFSIIDFLLLFWSLFFPGKLLEYYHHGTMIKWEASCRKCHLLLKSLACTPNHMPTLHPVT